MACISPNIEGISPIYFYNKPILSDCEANIVRLAKSAQQSGGGAAAPAPYAYACKNNSIIILFIYLFKI
jgi:hypothetical protein